MLKEAQFGPVPLGDLDARLNVLPLLLGRARLSLSRDEAGGGRFEGAITVSRHSFALEDMTGQLRTGALLAPVPIAAFDLDDVSVRFADDLCESAEGRVRVALAGEIGGIALPGGLAGDVRCAEGRAAASPRQPGGAIEPQHPRRRPLPDRPRHPPDRPSSRAPPRRRRLPAVGRGLFAANRGEFLTRRPVCADKSGPPVRFTAATHPDVGVGAQSRPAQRRRRTGTEINMKPSISQPARCCSARPLSPGRRRRRRSPIPTR